MNIQIKLAETEAERMAVFRFRYDVYVREMQRAQHYADHNETTIVEPLDVNGDTWMATLDDRVVGTVRWNVGNDEHLGYYENLYRLREFRPFYPHAVSITTKMIVAADFRRSRLPMQLCVAAYGHALERGVIFDVIDCNPPLVKFFQRFGYRQVFPEIVHPEYGRVVPLVLALHDTAHLRKIKSPFVGDAAGLVDEHDSDAFLNSLRAASGPLSIGENVNVAAGVGEPPTAAA